MSVFAFCVVFASLPARAFISAPWSLLLYCTEHAVESTKTIDRQIFWVREMMNLVHILILFSVQGLVEKPVSLGMVGNQMGQSIVSKHTSL